MDEAVARAIAASPGLARLSALEIAAEAQARGARADRWPQVDLGAGYTRRSDVPELAIFAPTGDPQLPVERLVVFPNIPDNWRLRAGVALPIYTGGRLGGQVEAAEQGRAAATEDRSAGRADLVLETKTAYWSLVTARESARVLQESIRAYDAHLADARNRERFGHGGPQRGARGAGRARPGRARGACGRRPPRTTAEANLHRLLDLPPAARVDAGRAARDVGRPQPRRRGPRGRGHGGARRARGPRRAGGRRRGVTGVRARAPGCRRSALTGSYDYANPNRDIVPPHHGLEGHLGRGRGRRLERVRRRAALRERGARPAPRPTPPGSSCATCDRRIRLEVTQRALELRTAQARLGVAERSVVSAAENRRVAADRYREGVIPSSELLDAELAQRAGRPSRGPRRSRRCA